MGAKAWSWQIHGFLFAAAVAAASQGRSVGSQVSHILILSLQRKFSDKFKARFIWDDQGSLCS